MSMYLLIICFDRHCVFFIDWSHGLESWIGVLDWSFGTKLWSGTENLIPGIQFISMPVVAISKHVTNA